MDDVWTRTIIVHVCHATGNEVLTRLESGDTPFNKFSDPKIYFYGIVDLSGT